MGDHAEHGHQRRCILVSPLAKHTFRYMRWYADADAPRLDTILAQIVLDFMHMGIQVG